MSEPSVLTYARYFNLTQEHTIDDPLHAIDTILTRPLSLEISQDTDETVQIIVKKFEKAAEEYLSLANDDPLPIPQSAAHYLDACTSYTINNLHRSYKDLLPDPYRLRKLKLDLPLLITGNGDVHKDVQKIRRSVDADNIIDDFLQDEEDAKDESLEDDQIESSTLATELLEWCQDQARKRVEKEKMDITQEALRYLKEAFGTHLGPENIWETIQNLLPQVEKANPDAPPTSPEDFDLEDEAEPLDLQQSAGQDHTALEDLTSAVKKELDILGQLDLAVDEEFLLGSTQIDREMEELFREFTHHDTEDLDNLVDPKLIDEYYDELPAAKKRKLEHKPGDELLIVPAEHIERPHASTTRKDFKIGIPTAPNHESFSLPDVNLSNVLALVASCELIDRNLPVPPFQMPTVYEAICNSQPVVSRTYEKYLTDVKNIKSSNQQLWKEPGIRILDLDEADEQDVATDNVELEDMEREDSVIEEPGKVQPLFPSKTSHDFPATSPKEHKAEESQNKSVFTPDNQVLVNVARASEEFPHRGVDNLKTFVSPPTPSPPVPRVRYTLPKFDRKPESVINRHEIRPIIELYQSCKQPNFATHAATNQSVIDREEARFRSLLPDFKRGRSAPNIVLKKEHKLDDSLANFLDLRGKRFKFPMPRQDPNRTTDMLDDPVQSTQDLPAESLTSDEKSLIPIPVRSIETNQQGTIPSITPLRQATTLVVNSTLLKTKKSLIQCLERPDETKLTLTYRDLDVGQLRGPDIILNSTTCLFITNLQSLNQRHLPGQESSTGLSSTHDQIASLNQSYSQVVVLVHHVLSTDRESQLKTTSAQACFSAFCHELSRRTSSSSSYSKRIQPYWLPCADPASTSKVVNAWVWQTIASHGHRNVKSLPSKSFIQPPSVLVPSALIQDETMWEAFLCKAGLNPMAAQVVLGSLRKPEGRDGQEPRIEHGQELTWGLRKLVAMGPRERVRLFAELIGVDAVKHLNEVFVDIGHFK